MFDVYWLERVLGADVGVFWVLGSVGSKGCVL